MEKRNIKKIFLGLLIIYFFIGTFLFTVNAASYPSLFPKEYSMKAMVGDSVGIVYTYFPEYKNEKIEVIIYDENDRKVANSSRSFYHTDYMLEYTVNWDTDGYEPGEYKIVAHKYFYTFNEWYEAPTPTTSYITLLSDEYCRKNGHEFNEYEVIEEATCSTEGIKVRECKNCTEKEETVIPVLNHSFSIEELSRPTCVSAGLERRICTVCEYSEVFSVPAFGHIYSDRILVQASCTVEGKKISECTQCGYTEEQIIPATGHISGEAEITIEPTYASEGKKEFYCTVCGVLIKTEDIEKIAIPQIINLKVNSTTTSTIKLSWAAISDVEKYIVYYSTNGKKWSQISASNNNATIKNLKAGTNYQVKVCAYIDGLYGENSKIIKTSTKVAKVTISTLKTLDNANITVSWKKITSANGYVVEYSTSNKFTKSTTKKVVIKNGNTTKTTIKGLKNNKKYFVRIKAFKTVNSKYVYGAYSAIKSVTAKKSVSINKTKATIYLGKKTTIQLLKNKKAISSSKITWKSSNSKIATVNKSGVVTGKMAGTVKITAKYNGISYICTVTVKSTVSVNKTNLTFKAGETTRKNVVVTFKETGSVYWKIEKGSNIIDCEWSRDWDGDQTKLYISLDGDDYGEAKIKIYSEDHPERCAYINVVVEPPISLTVVNKLPCIVGNKESDDYYDKGEKESKVKITNVDYEVLYGDTLNITVEFVAHDSYYDEGYYYFTYRILDEEGYVVEFDREMSERMYKGDKSKEEIILFDLEEGNYTIEFLDHYAKY